MANQTYIYNTNLPKLSREKCKKRVYTSVITAVNKPHTICKRESRRPPLR